MINGEEKKAARVRSWDDQTLIDQITTSLVWRAEHWLVFELPELHRRCETGAFTLPIPNDIAMLLMEVTANG